MMTESEAKERWCPLARPIVPRRRRQERRRAIDKSLCTNGTLDMRCIGSACMAWRTKHERICSDEPKGSGWEETNRKKDVHGRTFITWERDIGYCGAFGKE